MKTLTALRYLLLFALVSACTSPGMKNPPEFSGNDSVLRVGGAYALMPFVSECAQAYNEGNAGLKIELEASGSGIAIHKLQGGLLDIAMASRPLTGDEEGTGLIAFAVARTGVVLIINRENPAYERLVSHGLTTVDLRKIFTEATNHSWKEFLFTQDDLPVHHYHRADSSGAAEILANFLYVSPEDLRGFPVIGEDQMIRAIQNDIYGIGYSNFNDVFDPSTGEPKEGLALLPLDLDGNGSIEPREALCTNLGDFRESVCNSTYPFLLSRNLNLVVLEDRLDEEVIAFIRWIMTNGSEIAEKQGYARIPTSLGEYNVYLLEKGR